MLPRLQFRTLIVVIVLAMTLPLAGFAVWIVASSWRQQLEVVDRQIVDTARAISVAVDQRVERTIAALSTLATSPTLRQLDIAGFDARAEQQLDIQEWAGVFVAALDGKLLLDTTDDVGLQDAAIGELAVRVARDRRPMVSELHSNGEVDPAKKQFWVLVAIPVFDARSADGGTSRSGEMLAVLGARIGAGALDAILRQQNVPSSSLVTLLDQNLRIVARSRHPQVFLGELPTAGFRAAASRMSEGSWKDLTLEGTPSYCALSRSPLTGWTVGVGLASAAVDSALYSSLWRLGGIALLVVLLGLGLAFALGRRIVRDLAGAARAARALARGEVVTTQSSRIVEIDELSASLTEASTILRSRLDERDAAEESRALAAAEREKALQSEQQVRESLAREVARLGVTLSSIADAVVATDAQGRIALLNRSAQELTGWSETEAMGQPLERVMVLLDERTREELDVRSSSAGWGGAFDHGGPVVLIGRDGRGIPVEASAAQIRGADDRLVGVVLVFRDVTERRAAEQRRRALLEREQEARRTAEALNRSKDEFLAMLAHELRNPLAPILHTAQVLKDSTDAQTANAATVVERQVRHMKRLVEDLLDVARITSGRIRLRSAPVVLADALAQAAEVIGPQLREREQQLTFDPPPRDVIVHGDAERLAQVFANLLHNASKFTPPGGHVWFETRIADDVALVAVRDDGRGLDPDRLLEVFDAFRQIDPHIDRTEGGLGIGLTLVKRLVEKHGGTVVASSEGIGCGSTFTVRLPVTFGAAVEPAAPAADAGAEAPQPSRRVLVVDDNRDAADCLAHLLRLRGHEAYAAYHGAEALRAAGELEPDVVLVDIGLPDMDGYEVARALRDSENGSRRMRLIALTGYVHDKARSAAAGFDGHLMKPVEDHVLEAALR